VVTVVRAKILFPLVLGFLLIGASFVFADHTSWRPFFSNNAITGAALVNPGISPGTSTAGLWYFDEGSGTTAIDSSGNGNTGTLINGCVRAWY